MLGASSLVLVVTYPLMKRITFWPQLFLGKRNAVVYSGELRNYIYSYFLRMITLLYVFKVLLSIGVVCWDGQRSLVIWSGLCVCRYMQQV